MTQEVLLVENRFLSILSTSNLKMKAKEIKNTWEWFITNPSQQEQLQTFVRKEILDSWVRCQTNGVNPEKKLASKALSSSELELLRSNSELYRIAKPIIDYIYHSIIGTGYVITLNDHDGKMIYLKGEKEIIRKVEKMNFAPGMDWSEQAAGTNAIGTSIVAKMPIQIFSAEHFCEGFHPMTCSSSPIFHPYTKEVIGAIDLTGLWPSTQPHTLGLAVSLAQMIEQQLFTYNLKKYLQLDEYYREYAKRWKNQLTIMFSNDYVLVNGDPSLLKALQLSHDISLDNHLKVKKYLQHPTKYFNQSDEYDFIKLEPVVINNEKVGDLAIFNKRSVITKKHKTLPNNHHFIGQSPEMIEIEQKIQQISSIDTPILITGETGTGKEVLARYIHEVSNRKNKPFIAINCGALPKELIASELFGYEKGTFTGAKKDGKRGKFEEADGGTIFLDEIGEMPLDLQVHLLRVLQEKEFTRLGSSKPIKIDVKIIAATNRDLQEMIEKGLFRQDLYFRLNVISLKIPPLRERKSDILPLSQHFIHHFAKKYNKTKKFYLSKSVEDLFYNYSWPGNIRELKNAIEHAVIFSTSDEIDINHLPEYFSNIDNEHSSQEKNTSNLTVIEEMEKEKIKKLLNEKNGNISAVSRELNIARSTLYRKLKKYNL